MTTASIKTTADLAKESDSRQSEETPEIKTTNGPASADAPDASALESTAIAKPAEPKSEVPEAGATTEAAVPKSETPNIATGKPIKIDSEAAKSAATATPESDVPKSTTTAEPDSEASASTLAKPVDSKSLASESTATNADEAIGADHIEDKQPPKPAPEPVTAEQVTTYSESLSKLSFKNTIKLYELRGHLNRAQKSLTEPEPELRAKVAEILAKIEVLLEQNKSHQEQLNSNTELLLDGLKKHLEDGQSHEALPAWDKIQGNISNTSGKTRADLQDKASAYKAKIDELRDWKIFAATEKKKQMLTQMQHLIDSKMHASDRSKHIATMHKDWKLLGRSNQNEELWKEFKVLSDKAYEPCKEYFKQRKQLMAENLKQRRLLCDQLEKDIAELDTATVNISVVNKLVKGAEESWKKYAPIEQSKIKSLQKRYYDLLNQLRKLRRTEMRDNGKAKQQCIDEAVALELLDDNRKAMNEAKALQQRWKNIGPTSFKEDRKYWDEFRAACDKLFEQRNQEAEKLQSALKETEDGLRVTLKELEQLAALEEEQFRDSKSEYQTLAQKFSNDLDPRLKQQRSQLTEQFNSIKRKIDMRFKALPDKKFLLLKEKLASKIALLDKMESELNKINDLESFSDHLKTLDTSTWNELPKVGNESLDSLLTKRWKNLNGLKTPTDLTTLVTNETEALRKQCIELEIRANMETPDSDQATRMEIQLAQLKNAFGKSKPDRQENTKHAKQIEIQSLCFGPIHADTKQSLMGRLAAAIARLA
ncbi:MAG: hypothetical protein ACJA2Q_000738 [Pseudohongiellaceae bacterium]|jgi:hypothetical protein